MILLNTKLFLVVKCFCKFYNANFNYIGPSISILCRCQLTALSHEFSSLYPSDPKERAKVEFMLYWDMGTLYLAVNKGKYELH